MWGSDAESFRSSLTVLPKFFELPFNSRGSPGVSQDSKDNSIESPYAPSLGLQWAASRSYKKESRTPTELVSCAKMASFLSRAASNTQAQFATTAIVSGAVVAGTIFGLQRLQRESRIHRLKDSIPELENDDAVREVRRMSIPRRSPDERFASLLTSKAI
jgi:hypothetical protein